METRSNNAKQRKSLCGIKTRAITSNGPIWVQTQAHKNREWNK